MLDEYLEDYSFLFFFYLLVIGAPLILSMPHVLDAAPEYQTVKGLKPNREKAVTFVEVEPVSECIMIVTNIT